MDLIVDPEFAALIPPLKPEERAGLEASLKAEGCRDALVVWAGRDILLDGHNRYEICTCLGIPFKTTELGFEDRVSARIWIIRNQFGRRNLEPFQRAELALALEPLMTAKAAKIMQDAAQQRQDRIRELTGKVDGAYDSRGRIRWDVDVDLGDLHSAETELRLLRGQEKSAARRENTKVYFVQADSLIKIGISEFPEFRLDELRHHQPRAKLLGYIAGSQALEKALHDKYAAQREGGEWFTATDELMAEIQGLISGVVKSDKPTTTTLHVQKELAKLSGLSEGTIYKAKIILQKGSEEVKALLRNPESKLTIDKAYRNLVEPERRAERNAALIEPARLEGRFPVILADPPWRYEFLMSETRDIENHYPTMELADICALPVEGWALDDCTLFLWATSPKVGEAFDVLRAWGFTYRSSAVWDKEIIGAGYYFRQQHEWLLVATKGNPPTPAQSDRVSSVIRSRRTSTHSAKPEIVYEIIEDMYPQFYEAELLLELFQRTPRKGWKGWGNQIATTEVYQAAE